MKDTNFLDARDLRIGNIVNEYAMAHWIRDITKVPRIPVRVIGLGYDYDGKKYQVFRRGHLNDLSNRSGATGIIFVEGISITEEWLIKLGCKFYDKEGCETILKISYQEEGAAKLPQECLSCSSDSCSARHGDRGSAGRFGG